MMSIADSLLSNAGGQKPERCATSRIWKFIAYVPLPKAHLGSRLGDKGFLAYISTNPREAQYVPSVDVTMESVLSRYGSKTIAVLLTGMGDDGARAMAAIRVSGGHTIAESEETAIVFGMPKAAIERGGAEFILPAYAIGSKIVALVRS